MRPLSRAIRILIWGVVAAWIVAILRRVLLPKLSRSSKQQYPMAVAKAVPLHRDPWCGTYVSPEISVRHEQAGRIEHFCSPECLDRYAKSQHSGAASA
jgi:hypothetical protein